MLLNIALDLKIGMSIYTALTKKTSIVQTEKGRKTMRLIDANEAKEVLKKLLLETAINNTGESSDMCEDIATNRIDTWLGLVPTIDAVEVVRCKDCKYAQKEWFSKTLSCDIWWDKFSPEDFCSTGKRRDLK